MIEEKLLKIVNMIEKLSLTIESLSNINTLQQLQIDGLYSKVKDLEKKNEN